MIFDKYEIYSLLNKMKSVEENHRKENNCNDPDTMVPRVTEVLSSTIHEDGLMNWANGLGWKRVSYRSFMREAADKGTYSHLAIEKYIREGSIDISSMRIVSDTIRNTVISCLDGFIQWWNKIHSEYKDIKVIYLEETLIHDYFRGTCDCLLNVDGRYWLIDFKTSNHMNYKYTLQLAAYRFLLRELRGIDVTKCSVLKLDKVNHSYSEYTLDLKNEEHSKFIDECEETFMLLNLGYRMRLQNTDDYHKIFGIKPYKVK